VTKLTPAGNALDYSTYLGGNGWDSGSGIAVDGAGSAYVTGATSSTNFPTQSAYQATNQGYYNAFVTKLTPAGNALVYSTYLGGSNSYDAAYGIAVDAAGSAYVTGYADSINFPTQSAYQAAYQGGPSDAFVTKLTPSGNALVYSTYLGGSGEDWGYGIAVDSAGSAYVTGHTDSADFPTQSPYEATLQGGPNAFVTKLTPAGNALVYSTYLGGSGWDYGYAVAVDAAGSAYVTGETSSRDFPTQSAYQATLQAGDVDVFVTKLTPTGNALVYSTYLGGSDVAYAIAVDAAGSAYVTGTTYSADFPTQSPYQATYQGGEDVFVTKLSLPLSISKTHAGNFTQGQAGATYTVTVSHAGSADTSGTVTVTETMPSGLSLVSMAGTGWTCPGTAANNCTRSDPLAAGQSYPITVTVNVAADATSPQVNAVSVSDGGSGSANTTDWTTIISNTPVLSIGKTHTGNFTQAQADAAYTVAVSNGAGAAATSGTVTVTETVPAGMTLVSMAGTGWTCPGTLANNCTRNDPLAAGQNYPAITVTVNVASNAASQVTNQVSVSGGGSVSANYSDPTTITAGPVLSIAKAADAASVVAGAVIGYTVTVSNSSTAGTGTATGVTLNDPLPAGTGISWSISPAYSGPGTCSVTGAAGSQTLGCSFGNLAAGATAPVHVISATSASSCATYSNTATASASNSSSVQSSATTTVQCLANMSSPANHATLSGASVNFQWTAGTGATEYWLAVSKVAVAGQEIFYSDEGTNLSQVVAGLPTDGSTVYVRLWSKINGAWPYLDYTYTAAATTPVPAAMTSPANHATFTGSSVTFQWSSGTAVTQYRLYVSKVAVGGSEIYGATEGTNLSQAVSGLPTDGSTVYVRLGSMINGSWQSADYTYTAVNNAPATAAMTSPANNATLTGASVTFQWSTGTAVTDYWLAVGKVAGGHELYYSDEAAKLSQVVAGLPTDGSTVYVRLWSEINGAWPYVDYTYTAAGTGTALAAMTGPANHATLTGSSVTFQWSTGTGATEYWLAVSKVSVGGQEIYYSDEGTKLSQVVSGLPIDGSTVYVRLWSKINGAWPYVDYSYTAVSPTLVPAAMTSPANNAILTGSSVTFQWNTGTGVTQYRLYVSKVAAGGSEIYGAVEGTSLSQVVSGLPTDGSTVYVRLGSMINSAWQSVDYTYTAANTGTALAAMTSPANHATLSGSSVTFQWSTGTGATEYWLAVSKVAVAGQEIFYSDEGTNLSQLVTGLPTDGSTIYVRLWSKINGVWPFVDYTYSAASSTLVPAAMTSPANHATLTGASVTFQWNAGTGVTQYRLYVSKVAVGGSEIYGATEGTSLSQLVTGLPTDGSTVYVRLGSMINSAWQSVDYTYTAANTGTALAAMTSPANHATLTGSSVTFQWSTGTGATEYWLAVSKVAVAGQEIFYSDEGTNLSQVVTGLPTDGSTVYVRLWSKINGVWPFVDYTYTAASTGTALAAMTSPANNATLAGSSVNFQWSSGSGATEYWLAVSKVGVGGQEIFYSDEGTNLSQLVTGLPIDGSTVYVRLWSKINGVWPFVDYTYTAANSTPVAATMTSPANHATLTGASVTFQWSAGTGVTQYRLYVSKVAVGGSEIYGATEGSSLSQVVTGLPTDGSTVYVRLGSMISNSWQSADYTYTAVTIAPATAAMTSPASHATLTGSTATFQWSTGTGVTDYWLAVSKVGAGGHEIYYSDEGTNLSQVVTGLPIDGSTVYVRLWSQINGAWPYIDYTYTAANVTPAPATMSSPANHATLAGSSVNFQWTTGTGAVEYWLAVSKVGVGGQELYYSDEGTNLSQVVSGLPTDGSTIYVRLWSKINGAWSYIDYTYTAAH
jgi:uncharacterized repeat protein (TIGR01451 family)